MFGIDAGVANLGTDYFGRRQRGWDKQDRKNQRAYDRDRFTRLVEDSTKAGIHPLFAMGAGTTSPAIVSNSANAPRGAKSDIGQSIQAVKSMGQNDSLFGIQMEGYKLDNENKALENQALKAELDAFSKDVNKSPEISKLKVGGAEIGANSSWSDAQKIEDRYGDIVSWAYGLGVVGADLYQAVKERYPNSDAQKIVGEVEDLWRKTKGKKNYNADYAKSKGWSR